MTVPEDEYNLHGLTPQQALDRLMETPDHKEQRALLVFILTALLQDVHTNHVEGSARGVDIKQLYEKLTRLEEMIRPASALGERLASVEAKIEAAMQMAALAVRAAETTARDASSRADRADERSRIALDELKQSIAALAKQQADALKLLSDQIAAQTPAVSMKDVSKGWWIALATLIAGGVGWFTDWLSPK